MKKMKMKVAVALVFSLSLGFAATASAVRVSNACYKNCMSWNPSPTCCASICPAD